MKTNPHIVSTWISNIFEFIDRKKIKELFEKKPKENHFSKFVFNFISTKIFLDKTL